MFKLMVVAGPNRGASFPLNSGENSIGRQVGNVIVLPSTRVSKRHCAVELVDDRVSLRDLGSSNGTFVNGVLAKTRELRPGDRVSVGEFVFELVRPGFKPTRAGGSPSAELVPLGGGFGNVIQFPGASPTTSGMGSMSLSQATSAAPAPSNFIERLPWLFEHKLMPTFYGLGMKYEWKMLGAGLVAAFVLGSLSLAVSPVVSRSEDLILKEVGKRARFMAKQIAERNSGFLSAGARTKTEIGGIENEPGVRQALIIDMEGQIIAPSSRAGSPFTTGTEALMAHEFRKAYRDGSERGGDRRLDGGVVAAVEPIKVVNPRTLKNDVIAVAVVSMDAALAVPQFGDLGMTFSETFIYMAILGAFLGVIFYRLTLKPFEILNDDVDRALKGEIPKVTHEFKIPELNSLWDVINSAVQRAAAAASGGANSANSGGVALEDVVGPARMISSFAKFGMVVLDGDRKIVSINSMFEEISGIREDGSIGQELGAVARDQSLAPFTSDLFDRTPVGGEGVAEDFEFSGMPYRIHVAAYGTPGSSPKCFVLCAVKPEG